MKLNQPVTQNERTYSQDLNLISTTDLQSNITDANASFCEIAGFTLDELRNKPPRRAPPRYAPAGVC